MRFLPKLLNKAIHKGQISLKGPDGSVQVIGGKEPGPEVAIHITDPKLDWKIALNPELYAGEAYMYGGLVMEKGTIYNLLELFFVNKRTFDLTPNQIFWKTIMRKLRRFHQHNPISRARANVQHHYDIGNDLYRLFLDADMQYSCGYFEHGNESLEDAQLVKKRHIASKIQVRDGQRILDIGCGWGGLGLYLGHLADVEVVGVTLSKEQLAIAQKRAELAGVADRVSFQLMDYREVTGSFDRIVSVGMLEHVGVGHLDEYFMTVRDRMGPEGLALIHTISGKSPPGITSQFLTKYIFPGGYSPSLSEAVAAVERTGLWALDVEVWRKHYGWTLQHWKERCEAKRDEIIALYDEPFYRMWEFYLSACEGAFMYGSSHVIQMQLARERAAAPLTRDYIAKEAETIRAKESEFLPRIADTAERAFEALKG